jgi:hypothetical protein
MKHSMLGHDDRIVKGAPRGAVTWLLTEPVRALLRFLVRCWLDARSH